MLDEREQVEACSVRQVDVAHDQIERFALEPADRTRDVADWNDRRAEKREALGDKLPVRHAVFDEEDVRKKRHRGSAFQSRCVYGTSGTFE
jgi:hypothetical protein